MKRIDRYIIKQFLQTFLFALFAFIIVFVIIDLMEHLDDFIDNKVPEIIVVQYYIYFIPEIIKLVTPIAMLLSSLFTTGRMSTANEHTVLKAAGVSLYRFMMPFLAVALMVSILSIYFNGWVVPKVNKKKFNIERVNLKMHNERVDRSHIYFQNSQTCIITLDTYDPDNNHAWRVSIQNFDEHDLTRLTNRIDAKQMIWDNAHQTWKLLDGEERTFSEQHEILTPFGIKEMRSLKFLPDDVQKKIERPDEMEYYELKDFIQKQLESGHDVAEWQVDFYSKISFPFASLIVVLFGVPFATTKRRAGLALQFGISLGLCFVYLAFMKMSQVFGYNGSLNPLLTAWLANLLFLGAACFVMLRVQK